MIAALVIYLIGGAAIAGLFLPGRLAWISALILCADTAAWLYVIDQKPVWRVIFMIALIPVVYYARKAMKKVIP